MRVHRRLSFTREEKKFNASICSDRVTVDSVRAVAIQYSIGVYVRFKLLLNFHFNFLSAHSLGVFQ